MGTRLTQTSFSRGEIAPALYMRTDIEQYSLGCKKIKNGFIHQEGCVSNRSGLEFVGETKNSSKRSRLIPFVFNTEQTYMIEAGEYYFRFINDGGYIVYPDDYGELFKGNVSITSASGTADYIEYTLDDNGSKFYTDSNGLSAGANVYSVSNLSAKIGIVEEYTSSDEIVLTGSTVRNTNQTLAIDSYQSLNTAWTLYLGMPIFDTITHSLTTGNLSSFNIYAYDITSTNPTRTTRIYTVGAMDVYKNCYSKISCYFDRATGAWHVSLSDLIGRVSTSTYDSGTNTGYIEIVTLSGGYVLIVNENDTPLRGEIVEIATPYKEEDLPYLKYAQSADVLTITHNKYTPYELTRYEHHIWHLEEIICKPSINPPSWVSAAWYTPAATTTDEIIAAQSNLRTYNYLVCAVDKKTSEESTRSVVASANGHREAYWKTTEHMTITWGAVSGAEEYNVYREVNGIYGYLGTSKSTSFVDDNIEPDLKEVAPIYQNPFEDDNNPSCVTYFQQRKIYANSEKNPQTFWASQLAAPNNFNVSRPLIASDAITQSLADREVNEIRHLVGLNHLIALTSNAEYKISGPDGIFEANPSPIALVQSNFGSSHVQPVISGSMLIFVQAGGSVLRDLGYDYLSDAYNGAELSIFANHLFDGKKVEYMAYAKEPYRIIRVVFSDGTCAALTYNKGQKICGWTREITDGFYESAAAIREGQEDTTYFIVRRYINPVYQGDFEFIKSEKNTQGTMAYSYKFGNNTYYTKNPIEINTTVYRDNEFQNVVGNINVLNEEENNITIGGSLKRYVERTKKRIIQKTQEGFFVDSGLSETFENEVTTISGLDHLIGKKVVALSNGGLIENLTVDSNGTVTLPYPVKEITIGLPFEFKLETLNIEGENTHGLKKIINNVCVNILNSREEFEIGGNENRYTETDRSLNSVNDSNKLFTTSVFATPFNSPQANATIIIRQVKPLPLTILSLSAVFNIEDV